MSKPHISIVSPVYNAAGILSELVERITESVSSITDNYEIILVDDSSTDSSWDEIERLSQKFDHIRGFRLSRNFGQHYAITAGLDHSEGEWGVVMDCDLQDLPEEIPNLYRKAEEGYEVVLAARQERKDHLFKRLSSNLFYRFLSYLTGTRHDERVANFGIYHRKVIDQIGHMREHIRYFPSMVNWVGFKKETITVTHAYRKDGDSGYNFKKLANLALDIIMAYSDKPLRITIKAGAFIALISFTAACITLVQWYLGAIEVLGYTSLIISIWFLSGCILATLGVVGLYIGKTFQGVKNRPLYIIDKKT